METPINLGKKRPGIRGEKREVEMDRKMQKFQSEKMSTRDFKLNRFILRQFLMGKLFYNMTLD